MRRRLFLAAGAAIPLATAAKPQDADAKTLHVLPDGPERLAMLRDASRLLVAYMPYMLHMNRVYVDLAQPWVVGFRRRPFSSRKWAWIDIDTELKLARA